MVKFNCSSKQMKLFPRPNGCITPRKTQVKLSVMITKLDSKAHKDGGGSCSSGIALSRNTWRSFISCKHVECIMLGYISLKIFVQPAFIFVRHLQPSPVCFSAAVKCMAVYIGSETLQLICMLLLCRTNSCT